MSCPNDSVLASLDRNISTPNTGTYLAAVIFPWVSKIIEWLICVIGFLGNGSVLFIYKYKPNRTPSEDFILTMAGLDISMCVLTLIFTSTQDYLFPLNCFGFCAAGNFSFDLVNTSSSLLMIFITINRYVAVCKPHSYKVLFSRSRTLSCIFSCFVIGIMNCPVGIIMCSDFLVPSNLDCACFELVHEVQDVDFLKLIWVFIRTLMLTVNACVMIKCYSRIYAKMVDRAKSKGSAQNVAEIRRAIEAEETTIAPIAAKKIEMTTSIRSSDHSSKTEALRVKPNEQNLVSQSPSENCQNRKPSNQPRIQRSRDQKLTTTLFVVSLAYVVLVTPDLAIHVADGFSLLKSEMFTNVRTVTQTLYLINFVINPFIHLTINSYFKTEFYQRFGCFCASSSRV